MKKTYINSRQEFIEWKTDSINSYLNYMPSNYDEKEPKSYPCIMVETDDENGFGEPTTSYGFVYLSDFIIDYA